jgi:hypothetical protein
MKRLYATSALAALLTAGAALAQEAKLEFKFAPGTYTSRSTTRMKQVVTVGAADIPTTVDISATTRYTVSPRGADGTVRIEEKPEAVTAKLDITGAGVVEFDSAKPDDNKPGAEPLLGIFNMFRAMSRAGYTLVLDKNNKASAVEGIEKALEAAGEVRDQVKEALDPAQLKRQADERYGVLPDKPVKKGDRWTRTLVQVMGGGRTFTSENFYEYQGTVEKGGKTYDKIAVFTNGAKFAKAASADDPTVITANDLKVDTSSGTILFDRELGRIVEQTTTLHVSGPMAITVNGMELTAKFDMTMDSTESVK